MLRANFAMWRTYVICVLIGLLLVSTGSNVRSIPVSTPSRNKNTGDSLSWARADSRATMASVGPER